MEEDTGKLTHIGGTDGRIHGATSSLVDCNRAGVPLIEIVTKPIIGAGHRAPEVARAYVAALRDLVKALGVSDARMDQGSMRVDSNVSLKPIGATEFAPAPKRKILTPCAPSTRRSATKCSGKPRSSPTAAPLSRKPATIKKPTGPPPRADPRKPPRTTATSTTPTCPQSSPRRNGWKKSGPPSRNCPGCGKPASSKNGASPTLKCGTLSTPAPSNPSSPPLRRALLPARPAPGGFPTWRKKPTSKA